MPIAATNATQLGQGRDRMEYQAHGMPSRSVKQPACALSVRYVGTGVVCVDVHDQPVQIRAAVVSVVRVSTDPAQLPTSSLPCSCGMEARRQAAAVAASASTPHALQPTGAANTPLCLLYTSPSPRD